MKHTYMAIGAHVGDNILQAGLSLCNFSLKGHKIILVSITPGERGNPKNVSVEDYKKQKIKEANSFANLLGGKAYVLNYEDGLIPDSLELRLELASLIRKYKPKAIFTHWKNSMHKDHILTHKLVNDASFFASLDMNEKLEGERHFAPVYFSENWEDEEGFKPYIYIKSNEEAYNLWKKALKMHDFIMNSKSFKYYNYYTSLAITRGALARDNYAEAFSVFDYQKKVVKDEL